MSLRLGRVLNNSQLKERQFTNSTAEPKQLHSSAKSQMPSAHPQQTPRGHMKASEVLTSPELLPGRRKDHRCVPTQNKRRNK
ncbi:hypothetical protein NQZ68_031573 [Dissostichus eleginoides]|nr:hypothetical protein NQZ68_031573 [Dissostichus eleginoides]